jgi:HD-like signal output (HDOD) protein
MAISPSKARAKVEAWQPEEVPPFPAVALKALNLMAGTDTSLLQLCNLIRPDPAFSTEVLRIANSPLVAFPKNITSVLQASMVLGFQRLRRVVITVGLRAYLSDSFTPLLRSCWRHSLACGMIAERIASDISNEKEFAYTAGILHDIGRIAMAVALPPVYDRVAAQGADRPSQMLDAERALYGTDHCQAGSLLVRTWHLPEDFLQITAHHHDLEPGPADSVASVVAASCLLADSLGFGVVQYRTPPSYSDLLSTIATPALGFPAKGEDLASELAHEMQLIESV